MAHADYNCCAICDCKLEYAGLDSKTKNRICKLCLMNLRDKGINIISVDELVEFIKHNPKAIEILDSIGFKECHYSNKVDETYRNIND